MTPFLTFCKELFDKDEFEKNKNLEKISKEKFIEVFGERFLSDVEILNGKIYICGTDYYLIYCLQKFYPGDFFLHHEKDVTRFSMEIVDSPQKLFEIMSRLEKK